MDCRIYVPSLSSSVRLTPRTRPPKVIIVEPGSFDTNGFGVTWAPAHPAYSNPALPATRMRNTFGQYKPGGDARKGAEAFYNIALVEKPPLHFPIGKMAVQYTKQKANRLLAETEEYAAWSDDMMRRVWPEIASEHDDVCGLSADVYLVLKIVCRFSPISARC